MSLLSFADDYFGFPREAATRREQLELRDPPLPIKRTREDEAELQRQRDIHDLCRYCD